MISHPTAYVVLVFNMALWGGALVVARGVHELAPPLTLTFWRWVVALLVLFPFVVRKLYQELPLKQQVRRSVYWIRGQLYNRDQRNGYQWYSTSYDRVSRASSFT